MKIALAHDYLTQFGGAERVLASLHDLFPDAAILTSVVDYTALPSSAREWPIRTLAPAWLPVPPRYHRALFPLYPRIFEGANLPTDLDVVVADSSAWSHRIGVADRTTLVCYCHSPARFLYDDADYLAPAGFRSGAKFVAEPLFAAFRRSDRAAAMRVDRYIANSRTVAERIMRVYGRDSTVIYPPVDIERFAGAGSIPAESWYLVVSRLVPHKRVDLAIDACNERGIPLKVIGTGRSLESLRRSAGPTVEVLGFLNDDAVSDHVRRCRALILPAAEDFGITAVEAQAAGKPVIAYGTGGVLESVIPNETGLFFSEQSSSALLSAIEQSEHTNWDSVRINRNAERFSSTRFKREISAEIDAAVASKRAQAN